MNNFFKSLVTNTGVIGEVLLFLWQRKLWWLIPMVAVLMFCGVILFVTANPAVAPFIYTLF